MTRKGDWIQTFSGIKFWPLDPDPDEVYIEDIAHALAFQCRYGGHSSEFYSVAEHSYLVSKAVPSGVMELAGLMHDASEAYLVDIPSPIKDFMPEYRRAEERLMEVIATVFGLTMTDLENVKPYDRSILIPEKRRLMQIGHEWRQTEGVKEIPFPEIECFSPYDAERVFLDRFHRIARMI